MGMFDSVRCVYPLPDPEAQALDFQTKSLDCELEDYVLDANGELCKVVYEYEPNPNFTPWTADMDAGEWQPETRVVPGSEYLIATDFTGALYFYTPILSDVGTTEHIWDYVWYEYMGKFVNGVLVGPIERIGRVPPRPDPPTPQQGGAPDGG